MDYSDFPKTDTFFSGSEKKIGVSIGGTEWILKFQYRDPMKIRYNHVSEYIGSHIFRLLGFEVQDTELGVYKGEQVVACRNFIRRGCHFVPFNDVGESTLEQDKERFRYTYDDIMKMLRLNSKLTDVDETVHSFWDIFIVDALLGNFDRHGANWGFLKENGAYRLAPVFDNGSCLYPQMVDEDIMRAVIESDEQTRERVFRFPNSQIRVGNEKSSYYDVISGLGFSECNDALMRIFPRIDLETINAIIDGIDCITEVHKAFYRHMIKARYEMILADSYRRLTE